MFSMENLVCEVDVTQPLPEGYLWYEFRLDANFKQDPDMGILPGRRIGATASGSRQEVLDQALQWHAQLTHVQFEFTTRSTSTAIIRDLAGHGLQAIPAFHISETPARRSVLSTTVERLSELGTELIKIAYPVGKSPAVNWGIETLRDRQEGFPRLSLTPVGCKQARVQMALAGSALVFAPQSTTRERMAASWYRQLATPEVREEVDEQIRQLRPAVTRGG